MFGKKKTKSLSSCVKDHVKKVQGMDKKTYLKYYIKVLEQQIKEASKILKEKKRELKRLR